MCIEFMNVYLNLCHILPIENTVPRKSYYFIPHQCVLRAQSTTTKLRVVFDASSKTSSLVSLNETLMVGPTIQKDLFSALLQHRLSKFAITADVTKMYRQVRVIIYKNKSVNLELIPKIAINNEPVEYVNTVRI